MMKANFSQFLAEKIETLEFDLNQPVDGLRKALATAIVDLGGVVVTREDGIHAIAELLSPIQLVFRGHSIEAALAWCLLWLHAPEYEATDDFS